MNVMNMNRIFALTICAVMAFSPLMACAQGDAADVPTITLPPEFSTGARNEIVKKINELLRQSWVDNEVMPSPVAEDSEWIRRVYLDIVGHIPSVENVEDFLASKEPNKRYMVIQDLLESPGYVRNWSTIWTNLCIGRNTPRRVSRDGMTKFFREAFARNRPWDKIVFDLVSAEGHFEENGEVNFLLAQMTNNDMAVQATAKTTRLFLGVQVQCTQCHDHPFNDWKQSQFWEFNSFFRQARRINHRKYDPKSGRMVDDYTELVKTEFSGFVDFEKRNGVKVVAEPRYFGKPISDDIFSLEADKEINRRLELAKLMTQSEDPLIARAFVNRMWGHFFGYGFTRPIDDMGPHNAASHPDLLEYLTEKFVESGHDIKQLISWIANTEAYNLTTRFNKDNEIDNPAFGETPLFSHMYVRMMEAEQLYDSLIVATQAHQSGRANWEQAERQRQQWMRQFVIAFGTDENDEATTFNGTIPQALMMMNGQLIQNAMNTKSGSMLADLIKQRGSARNKIDRLFLATLGRKPTSREAGAMTGIVGRVRSEEESLAAYQDVFWALLNSNEFIFIH